MNRRGQLPARDYFDGLGISERAKMLALFQRLADQGQIHNREKFKGLGQQGADLWEFKSFRTASWGTPVRQAFPGRSWSTQEGGIASAQPI